MRCCYEDQLSDGVQFQGKTKYLFPKATRVQLSHEELTPGGVKNVKEMNLRM